jgi:ABC-type transport system substrate-binding protein
MKCINRILLLFIPLLVIVQGCGSADEILVVRESPRTGTSDTTGTVQSDEFTRLTIGLIEPVTNLDPLFADNLSSMRVISLIYQPLFSLNGEGLPQPLLAEQYEVSNDSLEYVITLRDSIYFQDSDIFTAGVGRQLRAADIKWALERTAVQGVPPLASELLMNIQGYRSFFLEQRKVYDPEIRVIEGITGIETPDEQTVIFTLRDKDPDFTRKLASPLLSMYPREAVERRSGSLSQNPVGTGPYSFRSGGDNGIILISTQPENGSSTRIDRVDFVYTGSESQLFQEFARGEIDWIPEIGPQMMSQLISNGRLSASYADQFNLTTQPSRRITSLYLNSASEQRISTLSGRLEQFSEYNFLMEGVADFNPEGFYTGTPDGDDILENETFYVVQTNNPFARTLFTEINREWLNPDAGLSYLNVRVTMPEASLYSTTSDSFHEPYLFSNPDTAWLRFESMIFGVYQKRVSGIESIYTPWQLNLNSVRIND